MPTTTSARGNAIRDRLLFHTRMRRAAVRRLVVAAAGLALVALVRQIAIFGDVDWTSTVAGAVVVVTFGALAVAGATALADVDASSQAPEDS